MEAKKDLNNTQRKVLEEIYCEQATSQLKDYKRKRADEREKFVETVLEKVRKNPKGKAVQSAIDKLQQALKNADEFFKDNDVNRYTFREVKGLSIKLNTHYRREENENPDIANFDEETAATEERFDKARQEIRAKIWGMNTSYEEIEKEVLSVLASIK